MVIKVGINGFGRIGRVIFRTCLRTPDIEQEAAPGVDLDLKLKAEKIPSCLLSAINDPAIDIEYICYLIKFDSTHGKFQGNITHTQNTINIDGRLIKVFREKLPHAVPWQVAGVQYVVEASGMFTSLEKSMGHLARDGVKRVIVTAPSVDVPMIILGVNEDKLNAEQKVLSCGSSTLYCLAPIVKVLEENFGVSEGFITSIHAMTPSLKPLDGLCLRGTHWRDHRSIHQNIIPATTGSCRALAKIIPTVKDKMAGLAFRVPIVNVSVLDMTVRLDTNTNLQNIIKCVETAGRTCLRNIIKISNEEAVSSDFIGDSHSCILDADSCLELKPNFYKIICWYENEYSYACRVVDSIFFSERQFNTPVRLPCKMIQGRARITKKQDVLQQTERISSIECNTEVPKFTTSAQDNMCIRKPPVRPVVLRKPVSSHSPGPGALAITETAGPRDSKKRNELFKIWPDNNDAQKNSARQNRSTFFHTGMTFGPKQAENAECMKSQEHLENVKKEFSKMVNITEDLLKKSNVDKLQFGSSQKSSLLGVKLSANGESIDSKIIIKGNNSPTDNCILGGSSDYKSGLSARPTDCSNEAVRCCSAGNRNENNSEYKIALAVKKIVINKPYLIPSLEKMTCLAKQNSIMNFGLKASVENKSSAKAHDSLRINRKNITNMNFKAHMTKNDNYFKDSLSNKPSVHCAMEEQKISPKNSYTDVKQYMEEKQMEFKIKEGHPSPHVQFEKQASKIQELNPPEEILHKDLEQYLHKKDYNMRIIDEALQKRNIVLVNNEKPNNLELNCKTSNISSEQMIAETEIRGKTLNKQILEKLNRKVPGPVVIVPVDNSRFVNPDRTAATTSNWKCARTKLDLYDKLDSASATNSTSSFEVHHRKSQILQICDLSNSLEDLTRLDKICRIIEISDELSDRLFSSLDHTGLHGKPWSFRDLCERIQLDDFCNKVFGKARI